MTPRLLTLVLAASLLGCGGSDRAETYEATGVVIYQGAPVAGATVMFTPAEGRPATGATDDEGRFTLGTYDADDGAVAGQHQVAISKTQPPSAEDPYAPPVFLIPAKYQQPTSSGLTAEVTPAGPNDFRFELAD